MLITGRFESDSITFGTTTLSNVAYQDIFIVKYDALGNVLWAKSTGGTFDVYGVSISTDVSGNILVTGAFRSDSIAFGTTILTNTSVGTADIFIVKYDAFGNVLWAISEGGTNHDVGSGISTDISGNVMVTGFFDSPSITFGPTILTNAGVHDIFVAKLDGITGIAEPNATDNGVSIYPNPSTGQISITSSKTIDEVTITNPLGQVVYQSKPPEPSEKNISLQIKDDGIYFVTITSDKKTATGKVIVQH